MILEKDSHLKKLEVLFSWSNFHQNSSLEVNRHPTPLLMCSWPNKPNVVQRYYPFNVTLNKEKKQMQAIQKEIASISEPAKAHHYKRINKN